jgi:hypothetical protein
MRLGEVPSDCSVLFLLTTVPYVERCLELRDVKEYVSCMDLLCRGVVCICTLGLSYLTVGYSRSPYSFVCVSFKLLSDRVQSKVQSVPV